MHLTYLATTHVVYTTERGSATAGSVHVPSLPGSSCSSFEQPHMHTLGSGTLLVKLSPLK